MSCRQAGGTATGMVIGVSQSGLCRFPFREAAASQYFDCRAHEEFKTHEAAHRIAGQCEDKSSLVSALLDAEPQWFAWAKCDFVKNLFDAELGQHLRYEIELPGRDSPA